MIPHDFRAYAAVGLQKFVTDIEVNDLLAVGKSGEELVDGFDIGAVGVAPRGKIPCRSMTTSG